MIASVVFTAHFLSSAAFAPLADLPLKPPSGWTSSRQEGSVVMTPNDLGSGKVFTVVATPLTAKAGTLNEVYEIARKQISEVGTYEALASPDPLKSDGGWEYKFTVGSVKKNGGSMLAQVTGMKKGDQGGTVVVISDSIETMQKYGEALGTMLRGAGGPAKPPPTPTVDRTPGTVDLSLTVPAGWKVQKKPGVTIIEASKDEFYTQYKWTLLVLPTQPLKRPLREAFGQYWTALVDSQFKSKVVPLPLMKRLANGNVVAYDGDASAEHLTNGSRPTQVCVFVLARGDKFVPMLAILYGHEKQLVADMKQMLESAKIPGASNAPISLFNATELAGEWSEGSSSFANYVTSSGAYAGDASIYTGSHLNLMANGTFRNVFIGISSTTRMKETTDGKWSIAGEDLILKHSKGVDRYSIFGYGKDPKAGRFLVISTYGNQRTDIVYTNPRGPFQASWYKVK